MRLARTMGVDDLVRAMKQVARDEVGHQAIATWGYVSAYDSDTHSIKAILPSFRSTGANGELEPIETDWIQLGTPWSGDGFGDQMAPYAAAATPDNPAGGEQVQITIVSSATGASVATAMLFNTSFSPPGGVDAGERIIQSQAGKSVKWGDKIIVNGGSTPVAVEGSTATHTHPLSALLNALETAVTSAAIPSGPAAGAVLAATLATALTTLASTMNTDSKAAAIDSGQGAQDFVAPSAGGT